MTEVSSASNGYSPTEILLEVQSPIGVLSIYRPSLEELQETIGDAKTIFVEAFSTTYAQYYMDSGSCEPIEQWLRLREELTLESWVNLVFDEEYEEYLNGTKQFIYVRNENGELIGWVSHSPVNENGELYLSQCSLEANSRNRRVSSSAFAKVFGENQIRKIFPNVKVVKLITRKMNSIARNLYTKAGFTMDETIDPSIYGNSYDDRYVGYRLTIELGLENE